MRLEDAPIGECVIEVMDDHRLTIVQADPRILISAQIVDALRADEPAYPAGWVTLDGDLLRVEGINLTVIYRIGPKAHDRFAYLAEWVD